jgi:hypothetical protein
MLLNETGARVDGIKGSREQDRKYSSIKFIEDLSISREGWYPSLLEIDDEGRIYVIETDFAKIYVYDKHGNEEYYKEFNQGPGPGDINFVDPAISSDGRIYIFDKKTQRLTIFKKDWERLETRELRKALGKSCLFFNLDSRHIMYIWSQKHNFEEGVYSPTIALLKVSPQGKYLGEVIEYVDIDSKYALQESADKTRYVCLYPPFGIFKLDADDFGYYALSDKYEIIVISPQGEVVRKIIRTGKTRKVTHEDTQPLISGATKALSKFGRKLEFIIPDRMPAIADFFLFENKCILVVTYEGARDSGSLGGNLFDGKGNLLADVDVPIYARWGNWQMLFKKGAIYKNKYFYTIEQDDDDDAMVKRYRVVWN